MSVEINSAEQNKNNDIQEVSAFRRFLSQVCNKKKSLFIYFFYYIFKCKFVFFQSVLYSFKSKLNIACGNNRQKFTIV